MGKRIIPFGDRILVKRRPIGNKLGSGVLVASEETADRLTEIADVVAVADVTMADKELLDGAEGIIEALTIKAKGGDDGAFQSLMAFRSYLLVKTIAVGDVVFIGRYCGTDFSTGEAGGQTLSIVRGEDIYGRVSE